MADRYPAGLVYDVSRNKFKGAWLTAFKIDYAFLKSRHKAWLDAHVVNAIESECALDDQHVSSSEFWQIWVIGATSRTAGLMHNQRLSRRRAEAVRDHLGEKMKDFKVAWNIDIRGFGEVPPMIMGKKDDIEDAFDRGVLVVARRNDSPPPLVTVPVFNFIRPSFCLELRGGGLIATKWHGHLYAVYDPLDGSKQVCDAWRIVSGGLSFGVDEPLLPGRVPGVKGGPPLTPRVGDFFAGYDKANFESEDELDSVVSRQWIDLFLDAPILTLRGRRSQGRRFTLKLETEFQSGWDPLIKKFEQIGGLGKRIRLDSVPEFPRMRNGKWLYPAGWGRPRA